MTQPADCPRDGKKLRNGVCLFCGYTAPDATMSGSRNRPGPDVATAGGLISGGTIVGCYGLVILIMGCVPAARAQARRHGWRAGWLGGREEPVPGGERAPGR